MRVPVAMAGHARRQPQPAHAAARSACTMDAPSSHCRTQAADRTASYATSTQAPSPVVHPPPAAQPGGMMGAHARAHCPTTHALHSPRSAAQTWIQGKGGKNRGCSGNAELRLNGAKVKPGQPPRALRERAHAADDLNALPAGRRVVEAASAGCGAARTPRKLC